MSGDFLRRYTDLPALIYLLSKRRLTLLDPASWDDSNDYYYLSQYKKRRGLESVLALCFSQVAETYHHWRVFASGSSGVCIRFNRRKLLDALKRQAGLRAGNVTYLTLGKIEDLNPAVKDLPFLKRYAFQDEREYRVIYESRTVRVPKLEIAIPLSCISEIVLSPWLHPSLKGRVLRLLKSIEGCSSISFRQSRLIGSAQWKSFADKAK